MYAEVGNTDFDYQCFEGHEIDGLVSHKTWTTRWYYLLVDLGNAVAGVENQYVCTAVVLGCFCFTVLTLLART